MSASVRYLEEKTAVPSLKQTQQTVSYLTAENTKFPSKEDRSPRWNTWSYIHMLLERKSNQ